MRIELATGTPADLIRPDNGSSSGGLVLWTDIFGLRPLFAEHARRLANAFSWTVVMPELFPGQEHLDIDARLVSAAHLADSDKLADLAAAIDVTGFDSVNTLGFCMGGMYAMKSLADDRVRRSVAFYGMVRVPDQWRDGVQGDALETVIARSQRDTLDLLCIFGGDDPWCPEADQDAVELAGAAVVRYPGAGHGWAQDPNRDGFRPDDAADAWRRAEEFLQA